MPIEQPKIETIKPDATIMEEGKRRLESLIREALDEKERGEKYKPEMAEIDMNQLWPEEISLFERVNKILESGANITSEERRELETEHEDLHSRIEKSGRKDINSLNPLIAETLMSIDAKMLEREVKEEAA